MKINNKQMDRIILMADAFYDKYEGVGGNYTEYHDIAKLIFEVRFGTNRGAYDADKLDDRCLELSKNLQEDALFEAGL